jgi:hypothetical protein
MTQRRLRALKQAGRAISEQAVQMEVLAAQLGPIAAHSTQELAAWRADLDRLQHKLQLARQLLADKQQ